MTRKLLGSFFLLLAPLSLAAQVQRYDFQPATGPVMAGFTAVTPGDLYSGSGHGFTTPPRAGVDGSRKTWNFFGRVVTLEEAIPPSVLSDATRDCVLHSRPFAFRTDIAPGLYDVTLWLGDVTTPRFQARATVNGVEVDVERMDSNARRGSFDQTEIGSAVPRTLRVDASGGFIEVTMGPGPGGGAITWDHELDQCPTPPAGGPVYTSVLVPAYDAAPLQALTIHPAADPPLVWSGGQLAVGAAPPDPGLQQAVASFNAGDLAGARAGFEALSDPALRSARAAGLFWVAGHPALIEGERELLADAEGLLEVVLDDDPQDWAAEDLLLQVKMADDAERFREALGYGGTSASENMGRSCSLTENWQPEHPYYLKGRILWLRNRGGLDPRRCSVSWERAQALARQLDAAWGTVNPFVHLYATDQWVNDGKPWAVVDWGALAGAGPDWARTLVRALNVNLDLSEWWIIHRQIADPANPWGGVVGEIGGGFTDDVELVGLFGIMAWLLEGASDISLEGTVNLIDGIWDSGVIDRDRGFEAAYADVEHSAEPTGDSLHLYPMVRYGDPEGMERIMKNAKTFAEFFLTAPSGHTHFKANHMSATQIGNNPNHRSDIPLCGRAVAPVPWLVWYSSNPGADGPLRAWTESWVDDAARTDKSKPWGVFPNAVVTATEEIGAPGGDWYTNAFSTYGIHAFPKYQYFLYNLSAFYLLRTGDPVFREPFDALAQYGLEYDAAGRPALGDTPDPGQESLWCGGKLTSSGAGGLFSLTHNGGLSDPDWDDYLAEFATSYAAYVRNPTDPTPLQDVIVPVADVLTETWPYRTTEGVMTDRIAYPGIGDVASYYQGANIYSVYYGLPVPAVTWRDTGRLFAAAVTDASTTSLDATLYLFADAPRTVGLNLWGLEVGGDYVLEVGPAPGLGEDPSSVDQSVPFTLTHRGEGASFNLPGRTVYALRLRQTSPGSPVTPLLPDPAVAERDVTFDDPADEVTVRVHNIGAAEAAGVVVNLYEGPEATGPLVGTDTAALIEAPNDLVPRWVEVVFPYSPPASPQQITVSVDPGDLIYEVTERNNGVTVTIAGTAPSLPPPMLIQLDPGTTPPGTSTTVRGRNFQPGVEALSSEAPTILLVATFLDDETLALDVDPAAPETVYLFSVRNPDGKVSNLLPLTVGTLDTVPPALVTGLRLARTAPNLTFTWEPVTTDEQGGPETVDRYEIWRGRRSDFTDATLWQSTDATSLMMRREALPGNGTAYYRVRARDAAGNLGL